jgi:hypothetical protein
MPGEIVRRTSAAPVGALRDARVRRDLSRVERQTIVRMAAVQGEGMVAAEKAREIDHVTRVAMAGHVMLSKWGTTLAAGDALLADEMRFFTDMARIGKGQVILELVDTFTREGR